MSTTSWQEDERVHALNERMKRSSLQGHWQMDRRREELKPWIWRWADVYECVVESGEVVPIGGQGSANNRRTVQLVNPMVDGRTTKTIQMSIQLVNAGETATAHRHAFNAMRFVVESAGMYTTANGEQMIMEPGDLLLQPGWAWHDHTNNTDKPAIWLDVLDSPITAYLNAGFSEPFGEGDLQPITKPDGWSLKRLGVMRPRTKVEGNQALAYTYKWTDTLRALEEMDAAGERDPYDGVRLEYTNPVTGGPTMPVMGCLIQMLRPGEETLAHRHTGNTIHHVVQGHGVTTVGRETPERFEWGERDFLYLPPWTWHKHQNLSKNEPAIVFSVTDRPVLEALGLWREEKG